MLWLFSYLVWWIIFMSWFYKQNMSTIRAFLTTPKIVDIKCEILDIVKNAQILLLFGVWNQLTKKIITPNLSKLGAFLTMSKNLYQGPNCQNCSDFAQIQCHEFFLWVDFTGQIWANSEHFWQCQKCSDLIIDFFPKFGSFIHIYDKIFWHKMWNLGHCQNALMFLIFVVWNKHTKWIHQVEFEQIWSIFNNMELNTNFWTMSKMLWLCSYLVWWILFMSWFYKQNMSTIGAFLTTPKFWI